MHGHPDELSIGELSRQTGVSVRALRHYESTGLLDAVRTTAGHRRFRRADVETVRRVKLFLAAGLPLAVVDKIIDCFEDGGAQLHPCVLDHLRSHAEAVCARLEALDEQRDALRLLEELVSPAAQPARAPVGTGPPAHGAGPEAPRSASPLIS
ncbi:DNA-binding transcriptional regulator, MerR family [Quadrisphaera granulorum]|uniref:DNA-binding transcriptional MerR regulator n=1 Tax=Quadrisphaera granulorum TaxID=317664 RepID=A0A316A659_9ACTN|nr:MerR family transcriptional regulator [Quadrisphaera granulorum]PWJ53165.1 DNA-binding transcriptional MerR regulator [Quadrisphaera granulorum]SZE97097.1 DNA-binding transcriptional regulator, MerR family [Quadrisphaera granulorum]